jgi:hypothetical protein
MNFEDRPTDQVAAYRKWIQNATEDELLELYFNYSDGQRENERLKKLPTHVWVAEYWPPYRATGRYTPHVYAEKPEGPLVDEVEWVQVPVRTEVPQEENGG